MEKMNRVLKQVFGVLAIASVASVTRAADIVDTAVGAGNFKTLAAALGAADLVDTLKGEGPFTVFAPTDDAFAKLPEGTVESLLKPENKAALAGILTYHVVPGKVTSDQVVNLSGAKTVNGQRVDISVDGSAVKIDDAVVTLADIGCDNGVIHVIDSVLLPADKSIPETAAEAKNFSTLLAAAEAAGLAETLGSGGPFTVFAPTDEAFDKLPEGTVASLLKPENKQRLANILKYHVVKGRVYSDDALKAKSAATLAGASVRVTATSEGAFINDAKLVATDLDASNGVIHVIDSVLMPPESTVDARRMLNEAVAQGAPLFNAGHHAACAHVYEQTLQTLMTTSIDASMKHQMSEVLTRARHHTCPTQRAWALRHGIDRMYAQIPAN
jgi:uncharacterized surface protein with fasciclin (FAS1) repeats